MWGSYRQNTNFTTRGILRDGFFVSPAVMPSDSVPPSIGVNQLPLPKASDVQTLTRETGSHKDLGKPSKAANKWCTRNTPILATDIMVRLVHTDVDEYTDDDEDDDGRDLKRRQPVLCCINYVQLPLCPH